MADVVTKIFYTVLQKYNPAMCMLKLQTALWFTDNRKGALVGEKRSMCALEAGHISRQPSKQVSVMSELSIEIILICELCSAPSLVTLNMYYSPLPSSSSFSSRKLCR